MNSHSATPDGWTPQDYAFMAEAIRLAQKGLYTTEPNPRVGCVLVRDGLVIGRGWHQKAGEPHAEVFAIQEAGEKASDSTAYVSLEPCAHQGRTGPCAMALINAGVSRVVAAMEDPNPLVGGQGFKQLRDAGIDVACGLLEVQARALNSGFIKRMTERMPWVRIKLAVSLDGRTAMASGESQWITGPEARSDVQRLRARSSAIISSTGTILADDASLTVRPQELGIAEAEDVAKRQPLRVILDWHSRLSGAEKVFSAFGSVLYCTVVGMKVTPDIRAAEHIETVFFPESVAADHSIREVLQELAARGCNEVLVEAGATLAGSFVAQNLWDELIVYIAPKLMGSHAKPMLDLPLDKMSQSHALRLQAVSMVGDDIKMVYVQQSSVNE